MMRYAAMELLISCFQYVSSDEIVTMEEHRKNILPAKLEIIYFCHSKKELMSVMNETIAKLLKHDQDVKSDKKKTDGETDYGLHL